VRYKLIIAYDGTAYCGWQVQKTGISIQYLIQKSLETIFQHPIHLTGSGRTDAGVHATGQTAHFDTEARIAPFRLRGQMNALLPLDIRILDIVEVAADFHARYSAVSKIYHYHLHLDSIADPFTQLYRHIVRSPCDLSKMQQAIFHLIGTHDFTSVANRTDQCRATQGGVRTLFRLELIEQKGGIRLEFEADGFLYKMVRNLTGLLLSVGTGRIEPKDVITIIASKSRQNPFKAVPPQGLFLHKVCYEPCRDFKNT